MIWPRMNFFLYDILLFFPKKVFISAFHYVESKFQLKLGLFEKGTKFEKIFHLKFDVLTLLSNVKYKVEDFFKFCALLKKSEL